MDYSILSWCGGFFDGEGSFSFFSGNPQICIMNTNPLAVSFFFEIMKKYDVEFIISEKSKTSKSSKKKRWDIYLQKEEDIKKFVCLMENYIYGKKKQLFLVKNFYEEIKQGKRSYKKIAKDYHQIMMYYNQMSNFVILDENAFWEKLGFDIGFRHHDLIDEENTNIVVTSFNDLHYFAGFIDAKAVISINKRNMNKSYDRYVPEIKIRSMNKEIIQRCCSTCYNNSIGYYVEQKLDVRKNKVKWIISISGVKRIHKLCEILEDKLIIKNRQLDLIHKYCSLRLKDLLSKNDFASSFKESIDALNKET